MSYELPKPDIVHFELGSPLGYSREVVLSLLAAERQRHKDAGRIEADEALMRQALEALVFFYSTAICNADTAVASEPIAALRARLGESKT